MKIFLKRYSSQKLLEYLVGLFILVAVIFIVCSFLIFQEGSWAYLDAAHGIIQVWNESRLSQFLQVNNNYTQFGYDGSQILSGRLLWIVTEYLPRLFFGNKIGLTISISSFFFVSFFSFYYLARTLGLSKLGSYISGLFFSFNPIALYFITEVSFNFVYYSMPVFLLGLLKYFSKNSVSYFYILLCVLGLNAALGYPRLFGIFLIFLTFGSIVYSKKIVESIKSNLSKTLLLGILLFLSSLPFLFSNIYPIVVTLFSKTNNNTQGMYNYVLTSISSAKYYWMYLNNLDFLDSIVIKEITPTVASEYYKDSFFLKYSSLFYIFLFTLSINRKTKSDFSIIVTRFTNMLVILIIFFKNIALITNVDQFVLITYKLLPFFANNLMWIDVLFVFIFSISLATTFNYKSKRLTIILIISVFIYLFLSIKPFIDFRNNPKLQLISDSVIPDNFKNNFLLSNKQTEGSLFYPDSWLNFYWSNYPIRVDQGKYRELISNNPRVVNQKDEGLNKYLYSSNDYSFAHLLNLRNIFLFTNIKEAKDNFDFYNDYKYNSEIISEIYNLNNNKNLELKSQSGGILHYILKKSKNANYELYLGSKTMILDLTKKESLNSKSLVSREVLIAPDENNTHHLFQLEQFNKIKLSIKKPFYNHTKYLVKITNLLHSDKAFMMQLNQSYSPEWKIFKIPQEYYDSFKCQDYKQFQETQNSFCNYKISTQKYIEEIFHSLLVQQNNPVTDTHFNGNLIGNAWIIDPKSLSENSKSGKSTYLLLLNTKQTYYSLLLLISSVTLAYIATQTIIELLHKIRR